jgi:hypothetical protein
MKLLVKLAVVVALLHVAAAGAAVRAADAPVVAAVHHLLDRYAANDQKGVLALLDPGGFVVYGSDASEKVESTSGLVDLMNADFRLWHTASFGPVEDLSVVVEGSLATAYFQVPFSAGGQPPVLVRFSTTWHKVHGEWRLRQSANTVPTVGRSALGGQQ